jgi:hypothetical protein
MLTFVAADGETALFDGSIDTYSSLRTPPNPKWPRPSIGVPPQKAGFTEIRPPLIPHLSGTATTLRRTHPGPFRRSQQKTFESPPSADRPRLGGARHIAACSPLPRGTRPARTNHVHQQIPVQVLPSRHWTAKGQDTIGRVRAGRSSLSSRIDAEVAALLPQRVNAQPETHA